jgi:hypothetical protein
MNIAPEVGYELDVGSYKNYHCKYNLQLTDEACNMQKKTYLRITRQNILKF